MVGLQYEVLWNIVARKQLKNIYDYIRQDSPQNAEKVLNQIVTSVEKLSNNPERFALDKYRKSNDGSYRFELYRYRIAFRIYGKIVRILRVRSTDQEPIIKSPSPSTFRSSNTKKK